MNNNIENKNQSEYLGNEYGDKFEQLVYWATHSGWRYCQGIDGVCGNEVILKMSHFNSMVNHILKMSTPTNLHIEEPVANTNIHNAEEKYFDNDK